jgi:hypothetical protein
MNISLKQKIKYWFLFLRLAHQSEDDAVKSNLIKSKNFYEPWGDYLNQPYDTWWKEHSHLFRTESTLKVIGKSEAFSDDALYLKIPFIYTPLTVSKMVKEIYEREYEKRNLQKGKVKKQYAGKFALSKDDYPVSQFEYYLNFTKNVYIPLMNIGTTGTMQYRKDAVKAFKTQKQSAFDDASMKKRNIPFKTTSNNTETLDRLALRYKNFSRDLLFNVSNGIFPGEYIESSSKNQAIKRKNNYPVRGKLRGVNQNKYQEVKERKNVLDPYSDKIPKRTY